MLLASDFHNDDINIPLSTLCRRQTLTLQLSTLLKHNCCSYYLKIRSKITIVWTLLSFPWFFICTKRNKVTSSILIISNQRETSNLSVMIYRLFFDHTTKICLWPTIALIHITKCLFDFNQHTIHYTAYGNKVFGTNRVLMNLIVKWMFKDVIIWIKYDVMRASYLG